MIHHCVFCKIPEDVDPEERDAVMAGLAALGSEIDGMVSFDAGPNRDYEGRSAGFSHGFVAVFRDRQSLYTYDAHPMHKSYGRRLVDLCDGGVDGLMVFDIEAV